MLQKKGACSQRKEGCSRGFESANAVFISSRSRISRTRPRPICALNEGYRSILNLIVVA